MLIVIVIIGILAAALIPRLTGIQSRARDTARASDLRNIGQGVRMYQLDFGSYPTATGAATSGDWTSATVLSGVLNGYMDKLPADGAQYMPYQYAVNNSKSVFALAAVVEGGTKAANWTGGNNMMDKPNTLTSLSGAAQVSEITLRTEAEMNTASQQKNSWRTVQLNG